jgi:hypothetical protein
MDSVEGYFGRVADRKQSATGGRDLPTAGYGFARKREEHHEND